MCPALAEIRSTTTLLGRRDAPRKYLRSDDAISHAEDIVNANDISLLDQRRRLWARMYVNMRFHYSISLARTVNFKPIRQHVDKNIPFLFRAYRFTVFDLEPRTTIHFPAV